MKTELEVFFDTIAGNVGKFGVQQKFWTFLLLNFVGQDLKNALWGGLSLRKHDFHVSWHLDVYGWVTIGSNVTKWYVNT